MQILWDQNIEEPGIGEPGNIYSEKQRLTVDQPENLSFILSEKIEDRIIMVEEHPLARTVKLRSDTLSNWWGEDVFLNASILLSHNYDATKEYPIRYNVAGLGGRYNRINRFLRNNEFMNWWTSDDAPEIMNVFLDGDGPLGDSHQMDSENSGPYGYSLIHELMSHIERLYRGTQSSTFRFVDGCSTGGWVSLALQLYYPDKFNGVFAYSPDPIAFEGYFLINIYKDKNAFINEYGYERPVMRENTGEPILSLRTIIRYENVLGRANAYLNSGEQIGVHTALYSPKGDDGLPKPLFDPITGKIDRDVADHWKKYDLKLFTQENWAKLGPKLKGKIYIWMGDMDSFYMNTATRIFDEFLQTTESPVSEAVIEFSAMEGHCSRTHIKKYFFRCNKE